MVFFGRIFLFKYTKSELAPFQKCQGNLNKQALIAIAKNVFNNSFLYSYLPNVTRQVYNLFLDLWNESLVFFRKVLMVEMKKKRRLRNVLKGDLPTRSFFTF